MTLVYSYRIPAPQGPRSVGVVMGGDTIVTTTWREQNLCLESGVTSQNQFFGPYFENEILKSCSEAACKIGRLNQNVLVSACGDDDLIKMVLKFYFEEAMSIQSYSDFYPYYTDNLCSSLSPMQNFPEGTRAEFIFAIYNAGLVTCVDMRYVVDEEKRLRHHGQYRFPSLKQPAYFKGSGHELFSDFSGSFHFNHQELYASKTIQQATALEVSNHISKKTLNDARSGIGGAILTYCLDDEGVHAPEDTIYVYANKNDEVTMLSKVCYRDGYFYLADYIEKRVIGFSPLELQIKGIQTVCDDSIQNKIKDISEFNAKWVFLTKEIKNDSQFKFEVLIQGNKAGKVVQNSNQDLFLNNLKNRKLILSFSNKGDTRNFNFKIRN